MLERTLIPYGDLRPLVGSFARPVVQVSGRRHVEQAARGLPDGPAKAEAVAVRLRRSGVELDWGPPHVVANVASLVQPRPCAGCVVGGANARRPFAADRNAGGGVLQLVLAQTGHSPRALLDSVSRDPGSGHLPRWQPSPRMPPSGSAFALPPRITSGSDSYGARTSSSTTTGSPASGRRDQERLDVHPRRFESQLRLLRLLGFRPLSPSELLAFHSDPNATIPGRRFVLAADDAFADAVAALRRHAHLHPHVFVCTSFVGAQAWWADNEPVASWEELQELERAGGVIESHSRGHTPLPELDHRLSRRI